MAKTRKLKRGGGSKSRSASKNTVSLLKGYNKPVISGKNKSKKSFFPKIRLFGMKLGKNTKNNGTRKSHTLKKNNTFKPNHKPDYPWI